jgi:hypothetical protein
MSSTPSASLFEDRDQHNTEAYYLNFLSTLDRRSNALPVHFVPSKAFLRNVWRSTQYKKNIAYQFSMQF